MSSGILVARIAINFNKQKFRAKTNENLEIIIHKSVESKCRKRYYQIQNKTYLIYINCFF